jgi:short-subunit dehydrogenase
MEQSRSFALATGGSGGTGKEIALQLAVSGSDLVLVGRHSTG